MDIVKSSQFLYCGGLIWYDGFKADYKSKSPTIF